MRITCGIYTQKWNSRFWSMSDFVGDKSIGKWDLKNSGVSVGISILSVTESELQLLPVLPPYLNTGSAITSGLTCILSLLVCCLMKTALILVEQLLSYDQKPLG